MRVAGRRTRVALSLLAAKPTGRRVRRSRRALRSLIRAAARSRDLDVGLGLFDAAAAPPTREGRLLRRRLVAARGASRRRMQNVLLDQDLARLRRDLRVVVRRGGEALPVVLARVHARRDADGAEVMTLIRNLGDRFDDAALHHLRTRFRRLRYLAEVDAEVRGRPPAAAKPLKRLQERLGAIHDAHVLAIWLGRRAAAAEVRGQVELAAEARRLEAHFVTESRVCHQRFLAEDPAGAVVFALARIGGRPRTPLASRPPNASEELAATRGAIEGSASPADPKAPPRWGVVEGRGGAPAKVQLRLAR
jgi:CHAD domain-containing protein